MNKKLLALAIGAAAAMPLVAHAGGPTLYGKVNLTLESQEIDTGVVATSTDMWQLVSNDSRIGIKGDAAADIDGIKGIYQAEFAIYADDGDNGGQVFGQRNIFAGLAGGFGEIKAGMFDTPLKTAQGSVDQFNDLAGDIKNIMPGETRAKNIIQYSSPKLGDVVTVNLALLPAEGANVDGVAGNEDGIADSVSLSAVMTSGEIYAALAMDMSMASGGAVDGFSSGRADIIRLVGGYKGESMELGAIFQTAEEVGGPADTDEDTAMLLSGAFISGAWKFKGQFGTGEGDGNQREKTLMSVGADYKMSKSTTVFGFYTAVDTDNAGAAVDTSVTTLALGIDQKF